MSDNLVLIDTNIIVYAINDSSPKQPKAQSFLQNSIRNGVIAHQNIFEALRVLTHKKFSSPMQPTEAITAIYNIVNNFHIIAPDYGAHDIALALVKKHNLKGDEVFDAYLAATAIASGIKTIASDNVKDFVKFESIAVINPFD